MMSGPIQLELPVDEGIVETELEDEVSQQGLDLASRIVQRIWVWRKYTQREDRSAVHGQ